MTGDEFAGSITQKLAYAVLPNGTTVQEGTQLAVIEQVVYGDNSVFSPGIIVTIEHLEMAEGTIMLSLEGGPLEWLEWKALTNHVEDGEWVVVQPASE